MKNSDLRKRGHCIADFSHTLSIGKERYVTFSLRTGRRESSSGGGIHRVSDKIIFDPPWMRQRAADCDAEKKAIQGLLRPADGAVGKLRKAAAGWTFLNSLDEMTNRWENLNKLLQRELDDSAGKIRDAADHHGKNEDFIEKLIDDLNPFN